MLATVRNRRGVISAVEPYAASKTSELLHLVTIEFSDSDGDPEEQLLWERERQPVVLEPNALPRVDVDAPMRMHQFLALQRATRWTAITPFISAENPECQAEPVPTAPVYGAVSADDFQLVPLARAMRMPRVSLLLADDVGLGKTVEAGLILTELVRKRRIRRVLIITPASLRTQWHRKWRRSSHWALTSSTRHPPTACRRRWDWMQTHGASCLASLPRTTICASPMCWSSSSPIAGQHKRARAPSFHGIC